MKVMRWLVVAAMALLLAGCEQAEYQLEVSSARRVDETIVAVVPPANAKLVEPMLTTVLGEGWRVRKATGSDGVHLTFRRHRRPSKDSGLELTRTVTGPLRLRFEYRLTIANPFAQLGENAFLQAALANQDLPVALRIRMPGGVLQDGDSQPGSLAEDGAGVWTFQLKDLATKPDLTVIAISRPWRFGILLLLALAGLLLLYVVGPELLPTAEKRQRAAERRAAKAAAKAEQAARRKPKAPRAPKAPREPKPPREPKQRRGRQPREEPLPLPPDTPAESTPNPAPAAAAPAPPVASPEPPPAPQPAGPPAPGAPAADAGPAPGTKLLWRSRQSQIRRRRRRRRSRRMR